MAKRKERLDVLLVERRLANSRTRAQAMVMAGEVSVDGQLMSKAGMRVSVTAEIMVSETMPYVGRGGYKLAAALDAFGVEPAGRTCADVGASTGGFTDVLLQRGAGRIYAIDVGYGQLDWKLRRDKRVIPVERTNARYVESLPEPVDLVAVDVSFISLRLVLPAVRKWLQGSWDVIVLIKPQFEAGRKQVGKGGIVKDPEVHRQVLTEILSWCAENSFPPAGLIRSPIVGAGGNEEFLALLNQERGKKFDLIDSVDSLLQEGA